MSAADVLVALRDSFSPRQLGILMLLHGYTVEPAEDLDVESALPFTLEDLEGAA